MAREKEKGMYIDKPKKYGNGAKLKAYKSHIGEEMVVMKKDFLKQIVKDVKSGKIKEMSDKEFDKIESRLAKRWEKN